MLIRRLKNWKYELTDQLLNYLVKAFKYKTVQDFMRAIALNKVDFSRIKEQITLLDKKDEERVDLDKERSAEGFIAGDDDLSDDDDVLLIDKSLTNVDYKLAKCCNPIFGDDIFGFVASMGGIKIHRKTCPNAVDMQTKFGYRIVKAQWTSAANSRYQATLKVTGVDDIGIVTNISQVISKEMRVKIRSMSIDSNEGVFEGTLTVFVDNTNSLSVLIKKIKNVKGVYSVSRIGALN